MSNQPKSEKEAGEAGQYPSFEEAEKIDQDGKNPGGIGKKLHELLEQKKGKKPVDAKKYQNYLEYALSMRKIHDPELFYLLAAGFANGLLSLNDVKDFDSKYLLVASWLEYLSSQNEAALKVLGNKTQQEIENSFYEEALRDEKTLMRNTKNILSGEVIDTDSTPWIVPLLSAEVIPKIMGRESGTKTPLATEGYKNAYAGFIPYLKANVKKRDVGKVLDTIAAFVLFDGILDQRVDIENEAYARLSDNDFQNPAVVDGNPAAEHRTRLNNMIREIAAAYEVDVGEMFERVQNWYETPEGIRKQARVQAGIKTFGERLKKGVEAKNDQGEAMMAIAEKYLKPKEKPSEGKTKNQRAETRNKVQSALAA